MTVGRARSRFLFVTPPLSGHVNPTLGVGRALGERGHDVAWAGSEMFLRPLLGPGARIYPTGSRVLREQGDHGAAAVKSLWERFIVPYTRFTLPAVERAVQAFRPDLVLSDQATPAGALVAHRHELPWASLACSIMELCRPFRVLPKVDAWMSDQLATLWAEAGLPPGELLDPRFSPYLVVAFTGTALSGSGPYPEHYALVGPALADRPRGTDFPWAWLDPARRHVLVTVGTLAAGVAQDFYARTVAALAPLGDRLQGIVVAPPEALPDPPGHVLVTPRVPMLELMPHLSAVVSHGGLNTVCETLAHGVPLVVAPIRHDQPIVAGQVAAAGAGIRVRFRRVSPAQLRAAVLTVLDDLGYRTAAERVRDSFAAAGGARAAADRIERLAHPVPDRQEPLSRGIPAP